MATKRLKSQADIDRQYSRIKSRAYQAYIDYKIDNYRELESRLNNAYDRYSANIAKNFGVENRYKLSKEQKETKLPYSVRAGING